jgi:hypothetical protein
MPAKSALACVKDGHFLPPLLSEMARTILPNWLKISVKRAQKRPKILWKSFVIEKRKVS